MLRQKLSEISIKGKTDLGEDIEYYLPSDPTSLPTNDRYSVVHQGKYTDLFEKHSDNIVTEYKTSYTNYSSTISGGSSWAPSILANSHLLTNRYLKSISFIPNQEATESVLIGSFNFDNLIDAQLRPTDSLKTPDNQLFSITPDIADYGVMTKFMLDGTDNRVEFLISPSEYGMIKFEEGKSLSFDKYDATANKKRNPLISSQLSSFPTSDIGHYWNFQGSTVADNTGYLLILDIEIEEIIADTYVVPEIANINNRLSNIEKDDYLSSTIYSDSSIAKFTLNKDASAKGIMEPLPSALIPSNFDNFSVSGKSLYEGYFYITPHTNNYDSGWISIINEKGELLWFKQTNAYCHLFKREQNKQGKNRHCYLETISKTYPTEGNVAFYENCELVVMNENFVEIDRVRCSAHGNVPSNYPVENHEYLYLDDSHYVVATYYRVDGSDIYHNSIVEIKNGKTVWYMDTYDYPELQTISHLMVDGALTGTKDYAHVNSFVIDSDGNLLVSFRQIGLVKFNYQTKEIMWVIGTKRNDFTGLATRELPYQQHDIQLCKDGSFTIFDNYGHESKTRIGRYYLNEIDMTATYKEYVTTETRSNYMGSAKLVDYATETFEIAYGSGWNYGFEEYDFVNQKQNMRLNFNSGFDMYRVFKDVSILGGALITVDSNDKTALQELVNYAESLKSVNYTTDSWENSNIEYYIQAANDVLLNDDATTIQITAAYNNLDNAINSLVIDIPVVAYTNENISLDGTNYFDTGLKLFEEDKDFTLIAKYNISNDEKNKTSQSAVMHCMLESQPWPGLTMQTSLYSPSGIGSKRSIGVDVNLNTNFNSGIMTGILDWEEYRNIAITRNARTGATIITILNADGTIISHTESEIVAFKIGDFQQRTLLLGAANMSNTISGETIDRYTVCNFAKINYYERELSIEQIQNEISSF